MNIDIILYRFEQVTTHTLGALMVKDDNGQYFQVCYTLELPFVSNRINVSCIPSGIYRYERGVNSKGQPVIHITNLPGRTYIQIHVANKVSELKGCIAPCCSFTYSKETKTAIGLHSTDALARFINNIPAVGNIHIVSQN